MTTANATVGTTWTLMATGPQVDQATIASKVTPFEIYIATSAPAETEIGFVVNRDTGKNFTLLSGEKLYARSLTGNNPVAINT
ncbi:MAG: hypothetical protein GY853_15640 [PVC group bacterium]|nr:hypothetical protein [PVC group bacterium]